MALLRKYITATVFDGYDAVTEFEFGGYSIKRIPRDSPTVSTWNGENEE